MLPPIRVTGDCTMLPHPSHWGPLRVFVQVGPPRERKALQVVAATVEKTVGALERDAQLHLSGT